MNRTSLLHLIPRIQIFSTVATAETCVSTERGGAASATLDGARAGRQQGGKAPRRDDLRDDLETVLETISETKIDCSYEMGESVSSRDRLYLH